MPYLHPPCGAILGLATDDEGNVLAAQAIMIERDGQLATQFGDGSGKINKIGDKGWYSCSAVRMPGPVEGPIVLAEGISTAIAIWQATGHECWAVLGAKRFSKVPLPDDRNVSSPSMRTILTARELRTRPRRLASLVNDGHLRWCDQRATADTIFAISFATVATAPCAMPSLQPRTSSINQRPAALRPSDLGQGTFARQPKMAAH